jgi:hypothetical protein
LTNKVAIPEDGIISIVKPKGVRVAAYINDKEVPVHHVHVKAGDIVHFALTGASRDKKVALEYGGTTSYITVAAATIKEGKDMSSDAVNLFATPAARMGGAIGGGLGIGLLGGVLGGALMGNNSGGLFGRYRYRHLKMLVNKYL